MSVTDRIAAYLAKRGGARPAHILQRVLKLQNVREGTARKILESTIGGDPRFQFDHLGLCRLALSESAAEQTSKPPRVWLLCAISDQPRAARASAFRIGLAELKATGSGKSFELELDFEKEEPGPMASRMLERLGTFAAIVTDAQGVAGTLARRLPGCGHFAECILPVRAILKANELTVRLDAHAARLGVPLLHEAQPAEKAQNLAELLSGVLGEAGIPISRALAIAREKAASPRVDFAAYAFTEADIRALPDRPGVYVMRDEAEKVVYVGKAANLKQRLASYFVRPDPEDAKTARLLDTVRKLEIRESDTELDALIKETELIRSLRPVVNTKFEIQPHAREASACLFVTPRAAQGGAVVFLLPANRGFSRVACPRGRVPRKRLRRQLALYFGNASSLPEPSSRDRIRNVLARRWLAQNRSITTVIEPGKYASLDVCYDTLVRCVTDPAHYYSKTVFAG